MTDESHWGYVEEGFWHPNVKSGQVHDHPENPGRGWSEASHRLCEPVYTKRKRRLQVNPAPLKVVKALRCVGCRRQAPNCTCGRMEYR